MSTSTLAPPPQSPMSSSASDSPNREAPPGAAGWLTWAGLLAGVGVLYWPTLVQLPYYWDNDPNYSHGYVIPLVVLFFLWQGWQDHGLPLARQVPAGDALVGGLRVLVGLGLHAACLFIQVPIFDVISLILVLSGLVLVLGGKSAQSVYGFACVFLIFMAPLPLTWYNVLAINLQQIASAAAAFIFQVFQIPTFREGCYIRIPGYEMEVGAACSGLRQLTAIIAMSLAVGHLSGRRKAYKWSLGLSSIPIAVAANCVRVTLTGFIMIWFGKEWAEGTYHTLEGLAIIGVAAGFLLLTAAALTQVFPEPEKAAPAEEPPAAA